MSEKIHLPNGWRATPTLNPPHLEEILRIAEEMKKTRVVRPPWEGQCASTMAALERQKTRKPEDDKEWANRPLPKEAQVRDDQGEVFIPKWSGDAKEVTVVEDIRRKARNTLGQTDLSGTTALSRESAANAFTYSKPATLTAEEKKKVTEIKAYTPLPMMVEEPAAPPKTFWENLWDLHPGEAYRRWKFKRDSRKNIGK